MPRRQILSSEEQERLLVIPDDEIILTRMCFLNEPDIALINKHRRPANRLGFAVLLCYLWTWIYSGQKQCSSQWRCIQGCFPTETSA